MSSSAAPEREKFKVAHVQFEIADDPENGCTFALLVADPVTAVEHLPLFSGHIERGMAAQLRALAARLDDLEGKIG